jgi:phage terminase large subunit-like protein
MSPQWTTALPDWERRIVAGESLIPFAPLFPDEAQAALDVFGELRMVDAVGSPLMRETVRPWVTEFVAAIFGAYDAEHGRRLVNEFVLLIAKKNGKSTIAAGIMLTALILNWRASGEFIILAPTKEVADNSFAPIRDMVAADDELKALLHVQEHLRKVTHRENGGTLKVVAADSDTVSGKKAIGVFVDELWGFGTAPKAEAMLREATGGLASRPEGFVIYATTHADDAPAGVWEKKLTYARKVRDGAIVNPRFLPVLYEFPKAMLDAGDHRRFENAYVTNPNFGLSVDRQWLEENFEKAQHEGEDSFRGFLAKHLNVEIGLALRSDRWAGADYWQQCGDASVSLDALIERSDVLTVGIDGGGLDDMLGLAVIGRDRNTGDVAGVVQGMGASVRARAAQVEAARFHDFAAAGDLVLVKAIGDDVREVGDIVEQVRRPGCWIGRQARGAIGVDAVGIGSILDELDARGIERPSRSSRCRRAGGLRRDQDNGAKARGGNLASRRLRR